jgi:4-hydroxy-tetrahydrodipicolinate synthase
MPLITEAAAGVFVIAVTPFTPQGAIDYASLDSMVDFYLEKGASGLTLLGMMGEAPKLTGAESLAVVKRVLARVGGTTPIVVGVSAPGFAPMQELGSQVMDAGAAGVMVAPPSNVRTDDQIYAYFETAAAMLGDTPFVLQDYPLATGVQISTAVITRIVQALPSCVMLKHEDWPGLNKIGALRAASDRGEARRISILCGNGGIFLPEELSRGADGAMTGFAYPEMMVEVCKSHAAGDVEHAHDIFDAYLPLARYELQPGLGLQIRKHILARRGVIASAALRAPAGRLSAGDLADIERLIARQDRKLAELG